LVSILGNSKLLCTRLIRIIDPLLFFSGEHCEVYVRHFKELFAPSMQATS
jgi:hypothetical protein